MKMKTIEMKNLKKRRNINDFTYHISKIQEEKKERGAVETRR